MRIPSSTPERLVRLLAPLLLLGALQSTPARAQALGAEQRQRAAPLVQAATRAYQRRDYEEARRLLAQAHALYPSPKLRYSQARVEEALGQRAQALAWYREFLRQVPAADRQREQDRDAQAAVLRLGGAAPSAPSAPVETAGAFGPVAPPPAPPLHRRPWLYLVLGGAAVAAGVAIGLGVALGPPVGYSALPDAQRAVLRF